MFALTQNAKGWLNFPFVGGTLKGSYSFLLCLLPERGLKFIRARSSEALCDLKLRMHLQSYTCVCSHTEENTARHTCV